MWIIHGFLSLSASRSSSMTTCSTSLECSKLLGKIFSPFMESLLITGFVLHHHHHHCLITFQLQSTCAQSKRNNLGRRLQKLTYISALNDAWDIIFEALINFGYGRSTHPSGASSIS